MNLLTVNTADGEQKLSYRMNMPPLPSRVVSGNTAIADSDFFLLVTVACTVTLPDAASFAGRTFVVKNVASTGDVTLDTTSGQLVEQALTATIPPGGNSVNLYSDNAAWWLW